MPVIPTHGRQAGGSLQVEGQPGPHTVILKNKEIENRMPTENFAY